MEKEFASKVVMKLDKWFNYQDEVWCKSGKYRIDYILTDKSDRNIHWGIEFKKSDRKRGENIGEHLLQSLRYTMEEWQVSKGVYKRIPILLCPPISYNYLMCPVHESLIVQDSIFVKLPKEHYHDRHDKNHEHHTVNGMIGVFCLGEIRTTQNKLGQFVRFVYSNKIIWSNELKWGGNNEIKGLNIEGYNFLIKKILNFQV